MDADARAHASQVAEDRKLVAQVITLLAQRLRLQMELLAIVPVETASQRKDDSLEPFLRRLQHQHAGQWEQMHEAWARLQQQSDDADWQLVHMRNRLDELSLPASLKPSLRSTSPFSDAVASGRSTVPIAEALLQSGSSSRLTVPSAAAVGAGDGSPASVSAAPSAEEQETFAAALAKEMKAMKESYEVKIEELQQEIRQVQRLRMESTQRLRSELDSERTRKGQIVSGDSGGGSPCTDPCCCCFRSHNSLSDALSWRRSWQRWRRHEQLRRTARSSCWSSTQTPRATRASSRRSCGRSMRCWPSPARKRWRCDASASNSGWRSCTRTAGRRL